jgi:hypothetical protein
MVNGVNLVFDFVSPIEEVDKAKWKTPHPVNPSFIGHPKNIFWTNDQFTYRHWTKWMSPCENEMHKLKPYRYKLWLNTNKPWTIDMTMIQ